jgi:uncharacterized repeat protein (TIGR03803 family)
MRQQSSVWGRQGESGTRCAHSESRLCCRRCFWEALWRGRGTAWLLLLLLQVPLPLGAQTNPPLGSLAVVRISGAGAGCNDVVDSIRFTFGYWSGLTGPTHGIFDQFVLTTNDIGKVFTISGADDPDFSFLVSILTNGRSDSVGDSIATGRCGESESTDESRFFSPLPPGGNNVDFAGFHIDHFALRVDDLAFVHSGEWTDMSWNLLLFVNSEPWSAPRIWVAPQDRSVGMGTLADFGVEAVGQPPLAYQWFFNETNALPGATSARLRLPNVQMAQAGTYSVVITNSDGAVTSAPAILSVLTFPPTILSAPADQMAEVGLVAVFAVSAAGSPPLVYQWFYDNTPIAAATNADILLLDLQPSQSGAYSVVITNAFGAITSPPAMLTVIGHPPAILTSPQDRTVRVGGTVDFEVSAAGSPPLSYQWSFEGRSVPGETAASLHLGNVQFSQAGSYAVIVTNVIGSATSAPAHLSVLSGEDFGDLDFEDGDLVFLQGSPAFEVYFSPAMPGWSSPWNSMPYNGQFLDSAGICILDTNYARLPNGLVHGRFCVLLQAGLWNSQTYGPSSLAQSGTVPPEVKTLLFNASMFTNPISAGAPLEVTFDGNPLPWWVVATNPEYLVVGADITRFAGERGELRFTVPPLWGHNSVYLDNIRFSSSPLAVAPVIVRSPLNQWPHLGSDVELSVVATGFPAPAYQWIFNGIHPLAGATNSMLDLPNFQSSQFGAYTVAVSNLAGVVISPPAFLITDPGILVPPLARTYDAEQTATFEVQAGGTGPLSYQWFKDGVLLSDGTKVFGAQTATLSLSGVLGGDSGGYSVAVSNVFGVITSVAAILTVRDPVITSPPVSQSAQEGGNVSFSVVGLGSAPLEYQWWFNGSILEGATGSNLELTNLQSSQAGAYTVVIASNFGTATSAPALLNIYPHANYTVLHRFTGNDGWGPWGRLVCSGTTLFGTTRYSYGSVFRINNDGSDFSTLHVFNLSDGAAPSGSMALADSILYGTTQNGGASTDPGTIFSIGTNGESFTTLRDFTTGGGRWPQGNMILDGTQLYGTTAAGGTAGNGTVFKVHTNGTGYTVLHHFGGYPSDGRWPDGALLLAGTTLYGATPLGGSHGPSEGYGTLFKIETDGTGYTIIREFTGYDGRGPYGGLVLVGTALYGTTEGGYSPNYSGGAVFRINTDGTGFMVLHGFAGPPTDGAVPYGGLVLVGRTLYGVTTEGGSHGYSFPTGDYGNGTIFKVNTDGSGYSLIKEFSGEDGARPYAGLMVNGHALYGTTAAGGISNNGVVFSLSLPLPGVIVLPPSQTAEIGSPVGFSIHNEEAASVTYQWFFNATNVVGSPSTSARFNIEHAEFSHVGSYTVVASNPLGAVTSAPVSLSVISPVERRLVPGLFLTGPPNSVLNLDTAEALASDWVAFQSLYLTNGFQWYFDLSDPLPVRRFYRAWQSNPSGSITKLNASMIPALTLAGDIGSMLGIDAINQFGPTNAWFTLNRVTLTASPQLYFDITAPGAPPRLYRLVTRP